MDPLAPLESFYDMGRGKVFPLPPELTALYGSLRFPAHEGRPYVIGNFVTTLDRGAYLPGAFRLVPAASSRVGEERPPVERHRHRARRDRSGPSRLPVRDRESAGRDDPRGRRPDPQTRPSPLRRHRESEE